MRDVAVVDDDMGGMAVVDIVDVARRHCRCRHEQASYVTQVTVGL